MVRLWRCEICGDPYVGESPPENCPFCGAHVNHIAEANKANVSFDIKLSDTDKANVEKALEVELNNAAFYFCAAKKTDDDEGKLLFKALGKVEAEHASIWRKVLKLESTTMPKVECHEVNDENLQESHDRETKAIEFYAKAAKESSTERLKDLFEALVGVENDHLTLSGDRLEVE